MIKWLHQIIYSSWLLEIKQERRLFGILVWKIQGKQGNTFQFLTGYHILPFTPFLDLLSRAQSRATIPRDCPYSLVPRRSPLLGRGYSFGCSKQVAMLQNSRIFSLKSASTEVMSRRLAGLFSYNIEFFICPDQQRWFTTNVFQPLGRRASAKMAG